VDLGLQTDLLVLVVVDEPFGETGAAATVLQEDEADLSGRSITIWVDLNDLIIYQQALGHSMHDMR
jgi:hypothetical protein